MTTKFLLIFIMAVSFINAKKTDKQIQGSAMIQSGNEIVSMDSFTVAKSKIRAWNKREFGFLLYTDEEKLERVGITIANSEQDICSDLNAIYAASQYPTAEGGLKPTKYISIYYKKLEKTNSKSFPTQVKQELRSITGIMRLEALSATRLKLTYEGKGVSGQFRGRGNYEKKNTFVDMKFSIDITHNLMSAKKCSKNN